MCLWNAEQRPLEEVRDLSNRTRSRSTLTLMKDCPAWRSGNGLLQCGQFYTFLSRLLGARAAAAPLHHCKHKDAIESEPLRRLPD